nr:MAG TPA: hypothetical protein [Caudoviricetes sp.]
MNKYICCIKNTIKQFGVTNCFKGRNPAREPSTLSEQIWCFARVAKLHFVYTVSQCVTYAAHPDNIAAAMTKRNGAGRHHAKTTKNISHIS